MSLTPSEPPMREKLAVWPCKWASIVQKRRMAGAATPMPSWGRSRSRKVRMKPSRQRQLASRVRAVKEDGKPPREIRRALEIEEMDGTLAALGHGSGERAFSHLARAQEGNDRALPKREDQRVLVGGAADHAGRLA